MLTSVAYGRGEGLEPVVALEHLLHLGRWEIGADVVLGRLGRRGGQEEDGSWVKVEMKIKGTIRVEC